MNEDSLAPSFRRWHGDQRHPVCAGGRLGAEVERPLDEHVAIAAGRVDGGQSQAGRGSADRSPRRQVRSHPLSPRPGAGDERIGAEETQRHGQQRREHRLADDQRPVAVEGGCDAQRPAGGQQQHQRQSGESETTQRAATVGKQVSDGHGGGE